MLVAGLCPVAAQQVAKGLTAANGTYIGFLQYTPTNYNSTSTSYPLIIFLHGFGERGNGTTELSHVALNGIPAYIRNGSTNMTFTWNGKTETFLVLCPQLSQMYPAWQDFYIDEMIKYAKGNLRIDTNRIFLVGFSMGGGGVWFYSSDVPGHASQFAGIVPVCPTCAMQVPCNVAQGGPAVWAFHAVDDRTASVACTHVAIQDIANCNPRIAPLKTIYPNGDHFIWNRALDIGHTWQIPNVYEWMLNQDRSSPVNKLPFARANVHPSDTSATTVVVDAEGSYDPDGTLLGFVWRKIAGPATGRIARATTTDGVSAITKLDSPGNYVFELKAVDDRAGWSLDTIVVTINAQGAIILNQRPVAVAGADTSITLPAQSISLDASASFDPENALVSFAWSKLSGPDTYTIANPSEKITNAGNLVEGVYEFRLMVADTGGLKAYDTIRVTVKPLPDPVPSEPIRDSLVTTPNPFFSYIDISYINSATGSVSVRMFDAGGRLVLQAAGQKSESRFAYRASTGALRAGAYYIEVSMPGRKRMVSRVLKN